MSDDNRDHNLNTHPQFFFQIDKMRSVCIEYGFCRFGSSENVQPWAQELKESSKLRAFDNIDRLEGKLAW